MQRQLISYILKVQGKGPLRKQPRQYTTASWRAVKGPEEQDIRDTRRGAGALPIPYQEVIYSAAGRPNTLTCMQMCKRVRTHTQALSCESNKAGRTGQPPNKITSLAPCLAPIHQVFLPNKSIKRISHALKWYGFLFFILLTWSPHQGPLIRSIPSTPLLSSHEQVCNRQYQGHHLQKLPGIALD